MTQASTAGKNAPDYLGHLDGVRGGAACWVLLAHCGIWGGWQFMPDPKIAVDIFMIMSGYLMAYHYSVRESREPVDRWLTAGKFWLRRYFRIAPVYYLILAASCLLAPWVREGRVVLQANNLQFWLQNPAYDPQQIHYTVTNVLMHVSFLFGLVPKYASAVFLPDWSIGLEMQFYLAFPLLFLVLRKWGYALLVLGAVVLLAGVRKWFALLPPECAFPEPSFLLLKLPLFVAGMLAAESHHQFVRTPAQRALAVVLAIGLAARSQSVYILAATTVVIFLGASQNDAETDGIMHWRAWLNGMLANRLTRFMADTSYSVYLIHGTFIALIGGWFYRQPQFLHLSPPLRVLSLALMVIVCSYLVAALLARWVERPGIRLGRKYINQIEARAGGRSAGVGGEG